MRLSFRARIKIPDDVYSILQKGKTVDWDGIIITKEYLTEYNLKEYRFEPSNTFSKAFINNFKDILVPNVFLENITKNKVFNKDDYDSRVLVRNSPSEPFIKAHLYKIENDKIYVFKDGKSDWTTNETETFLEVNAERGNELPEELEQRVLKTTYYQY